MKRKFEAEYLVQLVSELHNAIFSGNCDSVASILIMLPGYRLHIDELVLAGVTPLLRAVSLGNIKITEILIEANSDVNFIKNGKSILDFAREGSNTEIVKLLSDEIARREELQKTLQKEFNKDLRDAMEFLYKAALDNEDDEFISAAIDIEYFRIFSLLDDGNPETKTKLEKIHQKALELVDAKELNMVPIILKIPGDGDCMYTASIAGARSEENIQNLREMVATIIESDLVTYRPLLESQWLDIIRAHDTWGFSRDIVSLINSLEGLDEDSQLTYIRENNLVTKYISLIRQNFFWGGDVELGVISIILDIQINVHRPDGRVDGINNTGREDVPVIELSYSGRHYNLITGYRLEENTDLALEMLEDEDYVVVDGGEGLDAPLIPDYVAQHDVVNSTGAASLAGVSTPGAEFFTGHSA